MHCRAELSCAGPLHPCVGMSWSHGALHAVDILFEQDDAGMAGALTD